MALVFFKLLSAAANINARDWFEGTYASVLFPNAILGDWRISEHLKILGKESTQQDFFIRYLKHLYPNNTGRGIVFDSSGSPNNIHIPETHVNNHNGKISNEVRLLYVVDRITKMPIYFR
ncbi:MAG: hypothetical protein LBR53_01850 [Deltaproteobacteria bacterium]|nr:hypothetical protein [Deltaproteobacteria bacterium]